MWMFKGLADFITGSDDVNGAARNGFHNPLSELIKNSGDDVGFFVGTDSEDEYDNDDDEDPLFAQDTDVNASPTFPDKDSARKALVDKCAHYVYSVFGREISHDSDLYCNMSRIDEDYLLIPMHHPIVNMIVYHLRLTKDTRYRPSDHFTVGRTVFFIFPEDIILESLDSLKQLFKDYYAHGTLIETWRSGEEEEEVVEPWPGLETSDQVGQKDPVPISEKKDT